MFVSVKSYPKSSRISFTFIYIHLENASIQQYLQHIMPSLNVNISTLVHKLKQRAHAERESLCGLEKCLRKRYVPHSLTLIAEGNFEVGGSISSCSSQSQYQILESEVGSNRKTVE